MRQTHGTSKRWLAGLVAGLVAFAALGLGDVLAQGAGSGYYFFWTAVDERGYPFTGENVSCSVYEPQVHGAATLHTSATFATILPQPIWSDVNGRLHFFSTTNTPKDVKCEYRFGGSSSVNRLDRFTHTIVIDKQGRKVVRFAVNAVATATNQSSGITLPAGTVIRDVIIQNLAPDGRATTYHISVGFAGNHAVAANVNALVDAQALTSGEEWLRPHLVIAAGTSLGAYGQTASGNHRGTALSQYHQTVCLGGVCGSTAAGVTIYREVPYLIHLASGLDVTYAIAVPGVMNGTGARVHVYILFDQFHTGLNRQGLTN